LKFEGEDYRRRLKEKIEGGVDFIMKKNLLTGCVLGLFVLASIAWAAPAEQGNGAQAEPERNPETVLVRIETQEIKEGDIDQVIEMLGPQQGAMYDNEQGRSVILEELVASRLFSLSGAKAGLDQTPEFKAMVDNVIQQTLARAAVENLMKDVTASEEEAKKFYDENPAQFESPEQIHVRHILVSDDVTSSDKIALILDDLNKGVSFDAVAVNQSICPSAPQGGDLGFFGRGQMVPEFEEVAFALQNPGDISAPVLSSFGWHIIKLEEKRPASAVAYDEVKPQILQYLENEKKTQKYRETLDELRKEYRIEYLNSANAPDEAEQNP
jgi:peptidyl-prolyl cis-trans isomerase C